MAETTKGPSYYQRGSIQVWDFIRDKGLNFHLGNAVKYICRYGYKGNYDDQLSDLNKAIHYLENERNHLQWSRNRDPKDLPRYDTSNTFVSTSKGVQESVQHIELELPTGACQAAQPYSGGVQGISSGGRDVISFST